MPTLTAEELLKRLNFDILDSYILDAGDSSYFIVSFNNLEEKNEYFLKDKLNFKHVNDNIFISENEEYDERDYYSFLKEEYLDYEEKLWGDIINSIPNINFLYNQKNNIYLFKPTHDHFLIVLKWKREITIDEINFKDFINDINIFLRDGCNYDEKNFLSKYKSFKINTSLRNWYFHDSSNREDYEEIMKRYKESVNILIEKEDFEYPIDFVNAQCCILEYFAKCLDKLNNDLKIE